MLERHIILEGGYNVRDLGGYLTEDGHHTQWKILLRSGNLDKLSPVAQQNLIDYGVKTIVDLRDEWEMEKYPNVFTHSSSVTYHPLPLIGNGLSEDEIWKVKTESYETLKDLYVIYLADCQRQIGLIVSTIAESEGCTLFHCYAGKDRTGIIAALLLSAVGISKAVIADDYALTEAQIKHLYDSWHTYATEKGQDMARFEDGAGAKIGTMLGLLTTIEKQYGDVQSYLAQCGVSQRQIDQLRARFIC